jgi:hypothetical protein
MNQPDQAYVGDITYRGTADIHVKIGHRVKSKPLFLNLSLA